MASRPFSVCTVVFCYRALKQVWLTFHVDLWWRPMRRRSLSLLLYIGNIRFWFIIYVCDKPAQVNGGQTSENGCNFRSEDNSLRHSCVIYRSVSTFVQVMVCHLFGMKPLSEKRNDLSSVLTYRKLQRSFNQYTLKGKFSSLAALEVVILTTFNAASDENFIKMKTFPFQCNRIFFAVNTISVILFRAQYVNSLRPSDAYMRQ